MNYVSIIIYILCCYREVLNFTLSAPLNTCWRKKVKAQKNRIPCLIRWFFCLFVLSHFHLAKEYSEISICVPGYKKSIHIPPFNCVWLLREALLDGAWERTGSDYLRYSYYWAVCVYPHVIYLEPWRKGALLAISWCYHCFL